MRTLAAGVLVGVVSAALVLAADRLQASLSGGASLTAFDRVELFTYDWRLRRTARPETARPEIALVEIDESSLRNLEPNAGRWPWPRVVHSSLVDYLARGPARVIVYDVNFAEADTRIGFQYGGSSWSGAESDRALVDSIKSAGTVLLPADASFGGEARDAPAVPDGGFRIEGGEILERRVVFPPFPALSGAAAALGHSLFVFDADGPIRHTVPFVRARDVAIPSLGLLAALRMAGIAPDRVSVGHGVLRLADRAMPLTRYRDSTGGMPVSYLQGLIHFRGPSVDQASGRRTYRTYSFFDLLFSEEQLLAGMAPNIDPSVFRGALVFVGVTAAGLHDVFETPFAAGPMSGIQVHAAVADDVLSNRFIRQAGAGTTMLSAIAGAVAVGLVAVALPPWWATATAMALFAPFVWWATAQFAGGVWLNLSQPSLSAAAALFGGVAYQYLVEGREKRRIRKLFGQYVSKDVCEQLVKNPALARLGGQRREMTVLFSDIRGFTTVSEDGEPEEIVGMLNEYFTAMVAIVFRHHGTVDKFVGDMVMALFGAPLDDPAHADHAVDAALEMLAELEKLNARWRASGRRALEIGIGINTGVMIAGNIGSDAIMGYTVIGDAVNLGSRLESLNKQYGTRIIISEHTRASVRKAHSFRPLGDVVVKGRSQAVGIYELLGSGEAAAGERQ